MTMILDPKEIDYVVKNINKSLQVHSIDDVTIEELSQLIFTKLVGNGVSARIIEYLYNGKPFQSVQYYKQKTWFNFDYSGLDMFFQPVYSRTLDPQNIVKEEMVDVQYATPEYPDESDEDVDTEITQEEVNNGVTNWISNYISDFTSMVTSAVNNYLATHTADFKGNDGAIGPQGPAGPGFSSGTYRVPKLIETKSLTNVTTATFSNLNGDLDEEYLIVVDGVYTENNGYFIAIQPNGVNSGFVNANWAENSHNQQGNDGSQGINRSWVGFVISQNMWNFSPGQVHAETNILAKSGKQRLARSGYTSAKTDNSFIVDGNASTSWDNTTTNITSLVLVVEGTFTGTIKLYKMVDMVIA